MISRVGGKSKLKNKIISLMPPHDTYVEPFIGGGSVFFSKTPSPISAINDKDIDIYNIYKDMKEVGDKMINRDFTPERKKFDTLLKTNKFNSKEDRLYRNLYLSINSYSGNRTGFIGERQIEVYKKGVEVGKKYKTSKWKDFLNNNKVFISNKDFKEVIRKFDSPNTLFYLDPPYSYSKTDYKYNVDPQEVYDALQGIKGKFMLSYDFNPEIRKLFDKYNIKKISTEYQVSGKNQDVKEYLISNFN